MDLPSAPDAPEIHLSCTGALAVTAVVYAVLVVYAVQGNEHRLHRTQNLHSPVLAGSLRHLCR
jgi:hypothetical protein